MAIEFPAYTWFGWNTTIFRWINGVHGPAWDALMLTATTLGSTSVFPVWILAAAALCWWRPHVLPRRNVAGLALGVLASLLLVPLLKVVVAAPRPFDVLGHDKVIVLGQPTPDLSFPSGHTEFAVLFATSMTPGTSWWLRAAVWSFAACVGLSRIVVGHHFPVDVVGGAILGASMAVMMHAVCGRWWPGRGIGA